MLRLVGVQYLTECICAAMEAHLNDDAFRYYVTDCLHGLCNANGVKVTRRFYEIMHPQPKDQRDGMEISMERLERFGIKVVD